MRRFAWTLAALCSLTLGCNQPVETIPAVTPEPQSTSGTTMEEGGHDHDGHDHDGEHGGHAHAEGDDHDADKKGEAAEATDPSAANAPSETIRFVADKRLSVPEMMCPYSCWPKVKETLAGQPGVEAVQLAEQPAGTPEGEIKERVVELKLNGDFDTSAAIAALDKVSFKAELAK